MAENEKYLVDDPLWYKDAVIYELHVKSFYDSNHDGIGDFRGLMQKLDYLEGLGITAIWLLPFYPSPLRDDGYDIADYYNVHPDYGTMRDFRSFLREAHKRGIRVITELVVNHTSDQHPWFQRARKAPANSVWRNFYVWNDTPDKYKETRIIFQDFETSNWAWDPVAKAYYWHRFYSHQPDLNYDNPRVQKEILRVLDFWFGMGVDGMRLDAIPYLYEREGTNCENLPETHAFLKKLRAHVDENFKNKLLLAEANQWPEDAAAYFGQGDECNMAFHFPLMPRQFMAFRMEDRFPIIDILEQTPEIPDNCQWAIFLRNHDELTLEMVTDEERDYMYRVYAEDNRARINLGIRRRLAPLLDNNRRKIELMNILLFSLPGTPVIYYGDEIGMGDNFYLGDRDGVRTPMQWSADRNAGFSRTNPQKLFLPVIIDPEYNYEALNVENQDRNLSSLLWWMKRVIGMRKRFKVFSRGTLEFLQTENPRVLSFIREFEGETLLVVLNLSRFTQFVEIDLSKYEGYTPEEVFSQNKFLTIRDDDYLLTLGPYGHYWFTLEKEEAEDGVVDEAEWPELTTKDQWTAIFKGAARTNFEKTVLPKYLKRIRWFGGKARKIRKIQIQDQVPVLKNENLWLVIIDVEYTTGPSEFYVLPLTFTPEPDAEKLAADAPASVLARMRVGDTSGLLHDGAYHEDFRRDLFVSMARKRRSKGMRAELIPHQSRQFRQLIKESGIPELSRVLSAEQSNTSILYGNEFFLKLYRRIEEGANPEPEIIRFLSEKTSFPNIPNFMGSIEYKQSNGQSQIIALTQQFIQNESDAWTLLQNAAGRYFDNVLAKREELDVSMGSNSLLELDFEKAPQQMFDLTGATVLEQVGLLGQRSAEMHLALASDADDPNFAPEPFSKLYQRSLYQSHRSNVLRGLQFLQRQVNKLPEEMRAEADQLVEQKSDILDYLHHIVDGKISAKKTRIHGDYHLGQVLFTGKDFVIIDFEGEPSKTPSERRLKYSPFKDVAGMIRSFHYVVHHALFHRASIRPEDINFLEPWVEPWYRMVSGTFLQSYLQTIGDAPILPKETSDLELLLHIFLINKGIYELSYELNNRPDWLIVPIRGVALVLQSIQSI